MKLHFELELCIGFGIEIGIVDMWFGVVVVAVAVVAVVGIAFVVAFVVVVVVAVIVAFVVVEGHVDSVVAVDDIDTDDCDYDCCC